jgi:non-ribosomal peptide synthetase component F
MLSDANVLVLLTSKSACPALPEDYCGLVLLVDEPPALLEELPRRLPHLVLAPHNLAYCIYTSGSTGRPKGVLIEHRSVVNLIHWHGQQYQLSSTSRATSMAKVGFGRLRLGSMAVLKCWGQRTPPFG